MATGWGKLCTPLETGKAGWILASRDTVTPGHTNTTRAPITQNDAHAQKLKATAVHCIRETTGSNQPRSESASEKRDTLSSSAAYTRARLPRQKQTQKKKKGQQRSERRSEAERKKKKNEASRWWWAKKKETEAHFQCNPVLLAQLAGVLGAEKEGVLPHARHSPAFRPALGLNLRRARRSARRSAGREKEPTKKKRKSFSAYGEVERTNASTTSGGCFM